jgi:hypothetical protein
MLRKTAQGMERLQSDGTWALLEQQDESAGVLVAELDQVVSEENTETGDQHIGTSLVQDGNGSGNEAEISPPAVLDIEVPGLLSTDGKQGLAGQRRLDRLRKNAQSKKPAGRRNGSRVSSRKVTRKEILVPASAAEVSGPDSHMVTRGAESRRIVTREIPVLLENRPKWVQELFEAHFRSELALQLRHLPMGKSGKNRMKLSRADYAIGWLVCFDKAREDPGILRLRS